jgi:hypothetical protein
MNFPSAHTKTWLQILEVLPFSFTVYLGVLIIIGFIDADWVPVM